MEKVLEHKNVYSNYILPAICNFEGAQQEARIINASKHWNI